MYLKILSAATATNGAPTAGSATVGFPLWKGRDGNLPGVGLDRPFTSAVVMVKSTAGSGTMTVTLRLWAYSNRTGEWHPLGTNATADLKGVLNDGNAITETGTDILQHAEIVYGLAPFDRIYCQVTAIGGTATAVSVWLEQVE